jgi:SAM-dependent methyltransferase
MRYPDYKTYCTLYARYLDQIKAKRLLELAGSLKGKRVLDLCGGGGEITKAASKKASLVAYVEQEIDMLSPELRELADPPATRIWSGNIQFFISPVELFLGMPPGEFMEEELFDVALCSQAVNYWLNEATIKELAVLIKPKGLFVFNTFAWPPPEKPLVKQYTIDGRDYVEVTWRMDDIVHHVQVASGMAPHTTTFKWIAADSFRKILSPFFDVEFLHPTDRTLHIKCIRKPS